MLFLAIIVLLTSLAIASVAAYFSIIGLSMLFVGSGVSIIVMGTALEVGKLITVTTLHQMWKKLGFFLKTYLFLATIVLSIITSIGIYGFLSNGYNITSVKIYALEQNKEQIINRINFLKDANDKLQNTVISTKVEDDVRTEKNTFAIQTIGLINQKEQRIIELQKTIENNKKLALDQQNSAKSLLDEQVNKELSQIPAFNNRLQILDKEVQTWLEQGTGGLFRQNGLEKARQVKESQQKERDTIDTQIKSIQIKVDQLRAEYKSTIDNITQQLNEQNKIYQSNITKLEQEINADKQLIVDSQKQSQSTVSNQVAKAEEIAKKNNIQLKQNEDEIIQLNDKVKELSQKISDTDVGTFKFIAKNFNLELDNTVNWFIIAIIAVFDPLAVTLLLCFNSILSSRKKKEAVPVIQPTVVQDKVPLQTTTTDILSTNIVSSEYYKEYRDDNNKTHFMLVKE